MKQACTCSSPTRQEKYNNKKRKGRKYDRNIKRRDEKSSRYVGNNTRSRGIASSIERPLVSQMLGMNASDNYKVTHFCGTSGILHLEIDF